MQRTAPNWNPGNEGKPAISCLGLAGCAGLVAFLVICIVLGVSLVRSLNPSPKAAKQARGIAKIEATATPDPSAASSDGSKPTDGLRPTGTRQPPPTPVLDTGWTLYEKLDEGFGLALPPTWKQMDLDRQTLDATLNALKQQNPEMAAVLEGQARTLLAAGIRFFGFDLGPDSASAGFTTNVNVLRQTLPSEISLDVYVQVNVGQLENLPTVTKPVLHRRVNVASGEAEQLRYRMTMTTSSRGETVLAITQYLTIRGRTAYLVTLSTTADQAEKYAPTFEKIGQSFRVIR